MENKTKLSIAILLNSVIVVLQIVFGLYAHSMALITDAVHNFQDVVSLIIAYVAVLFMSKKPTESRTFGYLRSEVMAGFVNSAFLMGAVFLIVISSIERLFNPVEVDSIYVIVMGGIAFVINAFSAWLLGFHHHHDHDHEDLNIRAAYLHLLSDAGISLGVVAGGVMIYLYGIHWVDPLISILFSGYIFRETLPVLKKSYFILMEFVPQGFDTEKIKNVILSFPEVKDVHDLHLWALSSKDIYLSAHLVFESNVTVKEFNTVLEKIKKTLEKEGINHITLQPETEGYTCRYSY
ncbi:cation diffusion facilitator family transporter [Persephonella sp.]